MIDQRFVPIFIGDTGQKRSARVVRGEYVVMLGEGFYKIQNSDALEPFFMSIVSSSNHWLYISSTGGLSAGRVSADQSLFPYYTEDKLAENHEHTGNKTIILVKRDQRVSLWEPFSGHGQGIYHIERNIYKNVKGTAVVFEEINPTLELNYRYAWRTSDAFGFIKTTWLRNSGKESCQVELVDGLQNILPANVAELTQNTFSVLLDAYKRSELDPETGLAIFALNSNLTDLAEPSESLLATTVVQLGLDQASYLLSSRQLDHFRTGLGLRTETEVRGQRCAYFVHSTVTLAPDEERSWHLLADVCQDSAAIVHLIKRLRANRSMLMEDVERDIASNDLNLSRIVASADGLQVSNHQAHCVHHFANVMFNSMRGGVFADQYRVNSADFTEFVSIRNRRVLEENVAFFSQLPPEVSISDLRALSEASGDTNLIRLSYAYLPLSFSRRHGDPSRPWNRFTINLKKDDGSKKLDYEGNWRDIFQNWEALAYAFPQYDAGMICTFLNATSVDGYNPYRISRQGLDWELPQPGNPWANLGYWSDHQIIYLQKLMEISARVDPGKLEAFLTKPMFSYANIPYRIKPYADLLKDAYNTIDFDWELEREIELRVRDIGSDGKLTYTRSGRILMVTLAEKLLTLLLAKLVNFVPEGGIWMNTQRPEWNDANNALVGKGLSIVTLCYLRRFIVFYGQVLNHCGLNAVPVSVEVARLYSQVSNILLQFQDNLKISFSDEERRLVMDALGQTGSEYRLNYYSQVLSNEFSQLPVNELAAFLELVLRYVDQSLRLNKRSDNMFHAYNILHFGDGKATINHLYEMLEGQVAILSSGLLSGEESLALLVSMKNSQLYEPNQHSYLLYPDRKLPGFLEKNCLSPVQVSDLRLLVELAKAGDKTLITRDDDGNYHFSGQIHNQKDVTRSLNKLNRDPKYAGLVRDEAAKIEQLFENTFHHNEFTGRSGTFFAYEGLGSIYWHMVSKLLLAVQETILRTRSEPSVGALIEIYTDIRKGQCFNKTPEVYGAFPTDPYSHTPKDHGAKQPGMTGSVKEEIITRQVELGLSIENGQLGFDFLLLDRQEFLTAPSVYSYWSVDGREQLIELKAGSLAYSICQVPIILQASNLNRIEIHFTDGSTRQIDGFILDSANSKHIFARDGFVHHLIVYLKVQNVN